MLPLALFLYIAILLTLTQVNSYAALAFVLLTSMVMKAYFPQIKGYIGEKRIHRVLEKLGEEYRIFNDIYVPKQDGQLTQVDHVVVSQYGVFVIETKNYSGWIFGSEKQKNWTQTIYKKKTRFYNPILQNNTHIKALQYFLDLGMTMHSIIVFSDAATLKFKEPFEKAVVIQNKDLRKTITQFTQYTIPAYQLSHIEQHLQTLVPATRKEKGVLKAKHLQHLKENAQTLKKSPPQQERKS